MTEKDFKRALKYERERFLNHVSGEAPRAFQASTVENLMWLFIGHLQRQYPLNPKSPVQKAAEKGFDS